MTQPKPLPSQERLRELLHYEPVTGAFTWKISPSRSVPEGSVAGSTHRSGYVYISVDNKRHSGHRLAWKWFYGVDPVGQIDHLNGNKSDNRIDNLEEVSNRENVARACRKRRDLPTGVSRHKGRYMARIRLDGTQTHLGYFDTPEETHRAYLQAKPLE